MVFIISDSPCGISFPENIVYFDSFFTFIDDSTGQPLSTVNDFTNWRKCL